MATPLDERWLNLSPAERVKEVGHRRYVGGADPETWYGIGRLQYHFLVSQGLRHDHTFLDVACGALRLGQFLIPYLDQGYYFGLDEEPSLVDAALAHEVPKAIVEMKQPTFAYNSNFDLSFISQFDMGIAQSLMTHMGEEMIVQCLSALRDKATPKSKFFFTYFRGDRNKNPDQPYHPNLNYWFEPEDFTPMGEKSGWHMTHIGAWNHPRKQMMMLAEPG